MRMAGWPVCLTHQAWFCPPHMHWPVTLLRWRLGPQPPNANAGVTADDRAAEKRTTPSSVAEAFFMTETPVLYPMLGISLVYRGVQLVHGCQRFFLRADEDQRREHPQNGLHGYCTSRSVIFALRSAPNWPDG